MKKFILTILIIIAVAIVGFIIWLSTMDGSYDVKRSITINKSDHEVFELIGNFNHWSEWSPWLCIEPDAKVKINGSGTAVNDSYSWEGKLVGSGTITHTKVEPDKALEQNIVFKEPMESSSTVYWTLKSINDSTTSITWGMKGEMPFFLKFMTKMMEPLIGMDYDRGLKMLKDLAENGYVASKVEIVGIVDAPKIAYFGEKTSCTLSEMDESMKTLFGNLQVYMNQNNIDHNRALSIYHDFDFMKGNCTYTAAIPINSDSLSVDKPYYTGNIPATKALKIIFTGDYKHIGNGWYAGMSYTRMNKIKENKDIPPYELYITDPTMEPDPRKWVTEIYMPVK